MNNIDILFEDEDIIVCVKPAGTATQSKNIKQPDMESLLKTYLSQNTNQKGVPYLAVIHRLDQPVEGLLVFAKTPAAAVELSRQLTTSGFGKYYRAMLSAVPKAPEADLMHYLVKDSRTNTSSVCSEQTPNAKLARLHYKILSVQDDHAIVEIHLDTGRHHQIRVQMAAIGCPIIGDLKYGGEPLPSTSRRPQRETKRIALYACRLTFIHPRTKKAMTFELDRLS